MAQLCHGAVFELAPLNLAKFLLRGGGGLWIGGGGTYGPKERKDPLEGLLAEDVGALGWGCFQWFR